MNTTTEMINQLAVSMTACPRIQCQARPGEWCKTKAGNRATWIHARRADPFWRLARHEYQEGTRDGRVEQANRTLTGLRAAPVGAAYRGYNLITWAEGLEKEARRRG